MVDRKPTCIACAGAGGANYEAGTGIVIDDNVISVNDTYNKFKIAETKDWSKYFDKLEGSIYITAKTELCLQIYVGAQNYYYSVIIPKGTIFNTSLVTRVTMVGRTNNVIAFYNIAMWSIYNSVDSVEVNVSERDTSASNGVISMTQYNHNDYYTKYYGVVPSTIHNKAIMLFYKE